MKIGEQEKLIGRWMKQFRDCGINPAVFEALVSIKGPCP